MGPKKKKKKGGKKKEKELSEKLVENQLGKPLRKVREAGVCHGGVYLGPKFSKILSGSWSGNKG